jgi:hypothetical protein
MTRRRAEEAAKVVKEVGHSANLDQPDAFNRVPVGFLDSLP